MWSLLNVIQIWWLFVHVTGSKKKWQQLQILTNSRKKCHVLLQMSCHASKTLFMTSLPTYNEKWRNLQGHYSAGDVMKFLKFNSRDVIVYSVDKSCCWATSSCEFDIRLRQISFSYFVSVYHSLWFVCFQIFDTGLGRVRCVSITIYLKLIAYSVKKGGCIHVRHLKHFNIA